MATTWHDKALCRHFPALPWIADPDQRSPGAEPAMRVVCLSCRVFNECAAYVVRMAVTSGFWAGEDRTPESELRERGGAA